MNNSIDYYKFESIASENVGLYPIADEEMVYIPNSTVSIARKSCILFKYKNTIHKSLYVQPLGVLATPGTLNIYDDNGQQVLGLYPWYQTVTTWNAANIKKYLSSELEIKDMQKAGFNVKKTGVWYQRVDNCTVIRTRIFAPYVTDADYKIQYVFDVVLYDNGIIEYRYQSLASSLVKQNLQEYKDISSIRIFVKDILNSPDIYLSVGDLDLLNLNQNLDVNLGGRRSYGIGSVSSNYAYKTWPGKNNQGAIYRFIPPSEQIKKILPRRLLRRQDNNSIISSPGMYDDRKTIPFVNQTITMPTRMPTLYGQLSTFGTTEYQINSSFYLTGVVDPSTTEQWINYANGFQQNTSNPFSEINHFEENLKYTDFYKTGSKPEDVGFGFEKSLDYKVKISYELPINNQYTLLASTASLIYYDKRSGGFAIAGSGSLDGFYAYKNGFGDAKLYSAFGTPINGGYYGDYRTDYFNKSSPYCGEPLSSDIVENAPRTVYNSNINLSSSYQFSTASFTSYSGSNICGIEPIIFSNDLLAPFLLEKAIIEIPFCSGPGWLNDTTKAHKSWSNPYGAGILEIDDWKDTQEGGPCVTIGLIKENSEGKINDFVFYKNLNDPNYIHREVICSGTMIPYNDSKSGYHFTYDDRDNDGIYDITLVLTGFNVYSDSPSAIIKPNNGSYFTGSVIFSLQSQIYNNFYYSYEESGIGIKNTSYNGYQLPNDTIDLADENKPGRFENYKAIGPAGLDQAKDNRQYFGTNNSPFNYVTKKVGNKLEKKLLVNNPLKSLGISLSSSIASIINANPGVVDDVYVKLLGVNKNVTNSPYLLYPGDKLTLFVSKYHASEDGRNIIDLNNPSFGSSISQPILRHDIKINTGTIKITLFGSYIKEGFSYSPEINEPSTNNVSRIIGDHPILDQIELYSDLELFGTYTDNLVMPVSQSLLNNSTLYATSLKGYQFIEGHSRMRVSSATFGKLDISEEDKNSPDLTLVRK